LLSTTERLNRVNAGPNDVLWNFKRHILLDGQYSSVLRKSLLEGNKLKEYSLNIKGLSVEGERVFKIKLNEPLSNIYNYLAMISFSIFKKEDCSLTEDKLVNSSFVS